MTHTETACRPKSRDSKAGAGVLPDQPARAHRRSQLETRPGRAWGGPPSPMEVTACLWGRGGRGEHLQTLVPAQDAGDAGVRRPWRKLPWRGSGGSGKQAVVCPPPARPLTHTSGERGCGPTRGHWPSRAICSHTAASWQSLGSGPGSLLPSRRLSAHPGLQRCPAPHPSLAAPGGGNPSSSAPGLGISSCCPRRRERPGAQEKQGFRPPPRLPHLPVWRWAHLGFWDKPDDALSAVVWPCGFSSCCLSMSGCGLENPQAPAASSVLVPGGQPYLWASPRQPHQP